MPNPIIVKHRKKRAKENSGKKNMSWLKCANGMTLLREYTDAEQEQTAIYGISRTDWETRNMKHGT